MTPAETAGSDEVMVHRSPVWRERADFLFRARLDPAGPAGWEQLWGCRTEARRLVVCCIPFFTYGLALGDEVEVDDSGAMLGIWRPSGMATVRVWFGGRDDLHGEVLGIAGAVGALQEWSSPNLVALSVDGGVAEDLADQLATLARENGLEWEHG